ncbi:drug/metabolite transporter (DMT)-like permease [Pseudomonas psychrotolerans]|nr:drug/metabolite transporter (DMT)-like permease [Pseudomonas psychrotolerans]
MAEATAVNFLAPLMVTALSVPLLKETVSRSQWAAVLAGFVGVLVIVRPGGQLFTPAVLLPVCSAVCFGLYQLLTRILSATDSPTTSNFLTGVVNTLVLSALVPFFWEVPTLGHGFMLALLGFFGMTAHLLLTQAFRYAAPGAAGALQLWPDRHRRHRRLLRLRPRPGRRRDDRHPHHLRQRPGRGLATEPQASQGQAGTGAAI